MVTAAGVLMGVVAILAADETAIDYGRLLSDARNQRLELIQVAKGELAEISRALKTAQRGKVDAASPVAFTEVRGRAIFQTETGRRNLVSFLAQEGGRMKAEIGRAQKRAGELLPFLRPPFAVGQVGRLAGRPVVFQVVDGESMLIEVAPSVVAGELAWIEGIDTAGVANGDRIKIEGRDKVFRYAGGRQYETARGSVNSVPRFVAVADSEIEEIRRRLSGE